MHIYPLLTFLIALIYFFAGNYVFYMNPNSRINKTFMMFCLVCAVVFFSHFMMRQAAHAEVAQMWFRIGALRAAIIAVSLHFILAFTRQDNLLKKKLTYVLIYLPTAIFVFLDAFADNVVTTGVIRRSWGYDFDYTPGMLFEFIGAWSIVMTSISIAFCVRHYLKSEDRNIKMQSIIVGLSFVIPQTVFMITEKWFMSNFEGFPTCSLESSFPVPLVMCYAIWKYKLFTLNPATAAENILSTTPDFLVLIDPKLRILRVNKSFLDRFGYTEGELIGTSSLRFISEKFRELTGDNLERAERTIKDELNIIAKDGSNVPVLYSRSTVFTEEGNIAGYVIAAKDITERKKLESKLLESEKMASIGTISAGVAHEFNNLITIMKMGARMVGRNEGNSEDMKMISSAIDRAEKIVKNMLSFSRNKDTVSNKRKCSIKEPIESMISMAGSTLIEQEVELTVSYESEPEVMINSVEIQQVILNMLKNAHDAMMPEGGRLSVIVKEKNGFANIIISDTGKGINKDDIRRIFEPFFTTKGDVRSKGAVQGTGLGLSVSYGIITGHGGSIEVESEPGQGTTFTIKLPVA